MNERKDWKDCLRKFEQECNKMGTPSSTNTYPDRDTTIMPDEILNLIILLNTTNDVNEFLREIK
jgi:hypothetical protein